MFTGIVEQVGVVVARVGSGQGARLSVRTAYPDLVLGESVAVNGVCLTVDEASAAGVFGADASAETLDRTTLGKLRAGASVNLERALTPTSRLGGHIVSGHVDAVARLRARTRVGDAERLVFELPPALARFVAEKGSVALDGISLTVNAVDDREGTFDCMIIPHTQRRTTLVDLSVGGAVNLEVDLLARYAARLLGAPHVVHTDPAAGRSDHEDRDQSLLRALRDGGYVGGRGA